MAPFRLLEGGPMPDWLDAFTYTIMPWVLLVHEAPWIGVIVKLIIALLIVLVIHWIAADVLARIAAPFPFSRRLVRYGHRVGALVVYLLFAQVILRDVSPSLGGVTNMRHLNTLFLISALTWLGMRCVQAIEHTIIELNPSHSPNNLQARRIQTQAKVLARSTMLMLIVIGSGTALMTLPGLRQIGTSLLASAGVAGLVVGFAAKPVLGNLLAGMQIALTQPIRLEDVVIIQNEWGHIEEITGTYVVVRIWDQRRIIVPLQWFIENPFQNWTRTTSDILGTVLIWVDYHLPVEAVRKEAERLCADAPEWDGRLCQTQVVDTSEKAMHIRVLVSAGDAGKLWDLRCRLRENLIDFIQREFPNCLPKYRTVVPEFDLLAEHAKNG